MVSHSIKDFTVIDDDFAIENDWHCLKGKYTSEQSEVYDMNVKKMTNPKYVIDIWYKLIGATKMFRDGEQTTSLFSYDNSSSEYNGITDINNLNKKVGGYPEHIFNTLVWADDLSYIIDYGDTIPRIIDIGTEKEIDDAHSYLKLPSKEELGYNSRIPLGLDFRNSVKYADDEEKEGWRYEYGKYRSYNSISRYTFEDSSTINLGTIFDQEKSAPFLGTNCVTVDKPIYTISIGEDNILTYTLDETKLGLPFNVDNKKYFVPRLFTGYITTEFMYNPQAALYICLGVHPISDDE
jgi:hypothetical protein